MRLVYRGSIVHDANLFNKSYVFRDRFDAGRKLAKACLNVFDDIDYVFAIPMGGVPIGIEIARAFNSSFDLLICRKLLIPWNREAGFGAVDPDGNVFIDKDYASFLGLSDVEIEGAVKEQLNEIKYRNEFLRNNAPYPKLNGKSVILVDDGIATGYTMNVAIKFVRSRMAKRIFIAVPTGYLNSVEKISSKVNLILCLNLRSGPWFAVADAYEFWYDLTEGDVRELLSKYFQK